jgi:plasmid stability protein
VIAACNRPASISLTLTHPHPLTTSGGNTRDNTGTPLSLAAAALEERADRLSAATKGRARVAVRFARTIDMLCTCKHTGYMAKMIQVRNVPDTVHRTLKARAAMAGMSLSDFLLAEFRQLAERPTIEEMRERLHRREPVRLKLSAAQAVREERDSR